MQNQNYDVGDFNEQHGLTERAGNADQTIRMFRGHNRTPSNYHFAQAVSKAITLRLIKP